MAEEDLRANPELCDGVLFFSARLVPSAVRKSADGGDNASSHRQLEEDKCASVIPLGCRLYVRLVGHAKRSSQSIQQLGEVQVPGGGQTATSPPLAVPLKGPLGFYLHLEHYVSSSNKCDEAPHVGAEQENPDETHTPPDVVYVALVGDAASRRREVTLTVLFEESRPPLAIAVKWSLVSQNSSAGGDEGELRLRGDEEDEPSLLLPGREENKLVVQARQDFYRQLRCHYNEKGTANLWRTHKLFEFSAHHAAWVPTSQFRGPRDSWNTTMAPGASKQGELKKKSNHRPATAEASRTRNVSSSAASFPVLFRPSQPQLGQPAAVHNDKQGKQTQADAAATLPCSRGAEALHTSHGVAKRSVESNSSCKEARRLHDQGDEPETTPRRTGGTSETSQRRWKMHHHDSNRGAAAASGSVSARLYSAPSATAPELVAASWRRKLERLKSESQHMDVYLEQAKLLDSLFR